MLAQQVWNDSDFAKSAASWVAILGNLSIQPHMKMSEFFIGTIQISMETWIRHTLAQICLSHLYLQVKAADKVFFGLVGILLLYSHYCKEFLTTLFPC